MRIFLSVLAAISLVGVIAEKDKALRNNILIAFCVIIAGLVILSLAPMML